MEALPVGHQLQEDTPPAKTAQTVHPPTQGRGERAAKVNSTLGKDMNRSGQLAKAAMKGLLTALALSLTHQVRRIAIMKQQLVAPK
jgi:hypothetical protein